LAQNRSQRVLREAEGWARQNSVLLDLCFAEFRKAAQWPRLESIEHRLELAGHTIAAKDLVRTMPESVGFVEDGRLVLLCRALLTVEAAQDLLEDWFKSVRLAYVRWMENPDNELDSGQIAARLDGDAVRLRQVSTLLLRESWMFGSGHGNAEDEWAREIVDGVRVARDAKNARELLDVRAAIEWSDPEPPAEVGRPRRAWRYVSQNSYLAGLAVVATIALLGVGVAAIKGAFGSSPTSPPSQSPPVRERAGDGGARTFPIPGLLADEGPGVKPGERVEVLCRTHVPQPASTVPDGNWYRLASPPWNGRYFAPANSFWNGDVAGETPYTHNTDFSVPVCSSRKREAAG
jgi:hypothetical protein